MASTGRTKAPAPEAASYTRHSSASSASEHSFPPAAQHHPRSPGRSSRKSRRPAAAVAAAAAAATTTVSSPSLSPSFHDHRSSFIEHPASESDSRGESSSTMRNSATPLDAAVTYTPVTHRISKAQKGKRVHACQFAGCGKVFTRAEHKRRHELNHSPAASFPCDRPGCRKAFHRSDLLQRHLERHESGDLPEDANLRHRQIDLSSTHPDAMPAMTSASHTGPLTSTVPARQHLSVASLVHPDSHDLQQMSEMPYFDGMGMHTPVPFQAGRYSSDEYYTTSASQSPMSDQHARIPPRHRNSYSSNSSTFDFGSGLASPMISTTVAAGWEAMTAPPSVLPESMFAHEIGAFATVDTAIPIPFSQLDGHEWTVIRRELFSTADPVSHGDGIGIFDTVRWRNCLDCYWTSFHPLFPIIHRPTFFATKPSPLLSGAMVAIGSQYDTTRRDASQYSLKLLETATDLLTKRNTITSRSRLVDLQTILLLEILAKYRARRADVQVSPRFRTLIAIFTQAPYLKMFNENPLALFRGLRPQRTPGDLHEAHRFWVEHEARRRLLHATLILDTHQTILFQQQPSLSQHALARLNLKNIPSSLPMPCDAELWETSPVEEWTALAARVRDADLDESVRPTARVDVFQARLLFCHHVSTGKPVSKFEALLGSSLLWGQPPAPPMAAVSYHSLLAAKYTPVRPLLLVSGESWLLGRKLEHEPEFLGAQHTLRDWVTAGTESIQALWHATHLLRSLVAASPPAVRSDTPLLHEQWSVYLSTLICWAHGHRASVGGSSCSSVRGDPVPLAGSTASSVISEPASHTSSGTGTTCGSWSASSSASARSAPHQHHHPRLLDPAEAEAEMRLYLDATAVADADALRSLPAPLLGRTDGLLESMRVHKLQGPPKGGLVLDAERVLFRLVEGRGHLAHF